MWGVLPICGDILSNPIKNIEELLGNSPLLHGMTTCHSITVIEDQLQGDPLDVKVIFSAESIPRKIAKNASILQMFESTGWLLDESPEETSKFDVPVLTVVKSTVMFAQILNV